MRSRALRVYAVLLGLSTALEIASSTGRFDSPALSPSLSLGRIVLAFAVCGAIEVFALIVAAAAPEVPRGARAALGLAAVLGSAALACTYVSAAYLLDPQWLELRRLFDIAALMAAAIGAWLIAPRTGGGALGGLFGLLVTTFAVCVSEIALGHRVTDAVRFSLRIGSTLGVAALALLSEYQPARGPMRGASPYRDGKTHAAIPARRTSFEVAVATCCGAALWQYVVGFPLRPARVDVGLAAIALVSHVLLWPTALYTSRSLGATSVGKTELVLARRVGMGCFAFAVVALACLWAQASAERVTRLAQHVDVRLLVDPKTALVVVGMLDLAAAFVLVEALLIPMTARGRWRVRTLTPVTIVAMGAALVPAGWREAPRDAFVWTMLATQAVAMFIGALVFVRRVIAMLHIVLLSTVSYATEK